MNTRDPSSLAPAHHSKHSETTSSEVIVDALPVHCPNPNMPLWNAHPRVFIELTHGPASCPYCGTRYRLRMPVSGH